MFAGIRDLIVASTIWVSDLISWTIGRTRRTSQAASSE
jgi:hypothetical protein